MGIRSLVEWLAAGAVAGQLGAATLGGDCPTPGRLALWLGLAAAATTAVVLRERRGLPFAAGLSAAAAGALLVARVTAVPEDPRHVAHLELPRRGTVVGRVVAPPERGPARTVLVLEASSFEANGRRARVVGRVRVGVRGPVGEIRRGDVLAVETTLRRPRNFGNPGAFDMVGLLARRGVHVVASAWRADRIRRLARADPPPWTGVLDHWRDAVREAVGGAVTADAAAVLCALVIGDDGALGPELRAAFTRSGVVHVLSVSGLHVSIVAGLAAGVLRLVAGWSAALLAFTDVRKVAVAGGVLVAVGYGALAGAAVATLRAVAMAGAAALAVALDRRADPARCLALAALVLAIFQPGAPAEISYQLSFASVAALVASGRLTTDPRTDEGTMRRWLRRGAVASGAAWLATAPLTAFHFQQVSLVSVPANLVVVPLFGAVALAPALLGAALAPLAPSWAETCFAAAAWPVRIALAGVEAVGGAPWAAIDVPAPSLAELALLYAVTGAAVGGAERRGRIVLAAAMILLAVDVAGWAVVRLRPSGIRATFLDVGQGDASVVELPGGRVIVVDAGGFAGSEFDTGAAIVAPFLRSRKIQSVDALVMTHAHPDHAGGLPHLVRAFAPAELWWSGSGGEGPSWEALAAALRATGVPARVLRAGRSVPAFPEVEVLHPPPGWSGTSLNDGSLVLRIRVAGTSVLLAGDAEAGAEEAMLARGVAPTTVLKIPHHGSRTSSTWPFVSALAPEIAVASLGAENRYGHPAPEVVARYARIGARMVRTDRCGAVIVEDRGDGARVTTWRAGCGAEAAVRTPRRR